MAAETCTCFMGSCHVSIKRVQHCGALVWTGAGFTLLLSTGQTKALSAALGPLAGQRATCCGIAWKYLSWGHGLPLIMCMTVMRDTY